MIEAILSGYSWFAPVDLPLYTTSSVAICFNASIKGSFVYSVNSSHTQAHPSPSSV